MTTTSESRWTNDFGRESRLVLFPDAYEGAIGQRQRSAPHGQRRSIAEPSDRSASVAAARANRTLRRYVVSNRLSCFGTLTFAENADVGRATEETARFVRRIRRSKGLLASTFPYAWVLERGKKGRAHVHILLPPVDSNRLALLWSAGRSDWRFVQSDVPELRKVASYLSKSFDQPLDTHRYHVARGFAPEVILVDRPSSAMALVEATDLMGAVPDEVITHDVGGRYMGLRWSSNK